MSKYFLYIPGAGNINIHYAFDKNDEDYIKMPKDYENIFKKGSQLDVDLIEMKKDGLFHTGQDKDDICETVYCKKCGGKKFNVGSATYYTGIKCIKCGWEICIHEG